MKLSAVIRKEGSLFVSWCPEFDVASQGTTVEEALANLKEAVELYVADPRVNVHPTRPVITSFEIRDGEASGSVSA